MKSNQLENSVEVFTLIDKPTKLSRKERMSLNNFIGSRALFSDEQLDNKSMFWEETVHIKEAKGDSIELNFLL